MRILRLFSLIRKFQMLRYAGYVGASLWFCWFLRVNDLFLEYRFSAFATHGLILAFSQLLTLGLLLYYRDISMYLRGRQWMTLFIALSVVGGLAWKVSFDILDLFVPRSVVIFQAMTFTILLVLDRRFFRGSVSAATNLRGKRYLVYGASEYGKSVVHFLLSRGRHSMRVVGFMCDDEKLGGQRILGLPIFVGASKEDIKKAKETLNLDGVIVCGADSNREAKVEILEACLELDLDVRICDDPLEGHKKIASSPLRPICLEDLIGSDKSVRLSPRQLSEFEGKSVLITGGAGSIGREICFQILEQGAKSIHVIDHSELSLYQLKTDLSENDLSRVTLMLGDVTNESFLSQTFSEFQFDVVIHAAAYKHVYFVAYNPIQSIINNVVSTSNLITLVKKFNVDKFVLISTDKAVQPSNTMGATKRVCELLVQSASQDTDHNCSFTIVRFGNVLGSSGSAVPHFLDQIKAGGPVTVTDKRVSRYFMTIPDAVSLVLKSVVLGSNGDLFVLKMGEPIRIYDLVVSLIKAHGLTPDKDISIKFIGLHPEEKISEELYDGDLDILVNAYDDFSRYRFSRFNVERIRNEVEKMVTLAREGDHRAVEVLNEVSSAEFLKTSNEIEAA